MDTIGIIGAITEEVELYLNELKASHKIQIAGFDFNQGLFEGKKTIIVKSGVGKVNAAACTQILIDNFAVKTIIFTGVAGSLNPKLNILDIVISEDCIQHDLDATKLGFKKGQIPFTKLKNFKSSKKLINLGFASGKKQKLRIQKGRILTGDQFVEDKQKTILLRGEFSGDCLDMESAAVAQVCHLNNIDHVIIRSISDKADGSASLNFREFCKQAAKNSFLLVKTMLKNLKHRTSPGKVNTKKIKNKIRTIPHWPKSGIMFRDITTLLKDADGLKDTIKFLTERYKNTKINLVVGIESRGFIFGSTLAHQLGVGFVPIRKKGKLPAKTESEEYALEYGTDKIEIHKDAINSGDQIILIDDLIATGGTALAACRLLKKLGAEIIECCFIIDLPKLGGKKNLKKRVLKYLIWWNLKENNLVILFRVILIFRLNLCLCIFSPLNPHVMILP